MSNTEENITQSELKEAVEGIGKAFEEFKDAHQEKIAQIEKKGEADPLTEEKLKKIENRNGEIVISREKAKRAKSWKKMEKAFESKEEVKGIIISKCKGGFIVDVESCLCFLTGSQVDLKPLKNSLRIASSSKLIFEYPINIAGVHFLNTFSISPII